MERAGRATWTGSREGSGDRAGCEGIKHLGYVAKTPFTDFTDEKEDKTRIHRTGTLRWTQTLFTIPRPNMIMSANEPL